MDFYDLIRTRYRCRRYLDNPVEQELAETLIAASSLREQGEKRL